MRRETAESRAQLAWNLQCKTYVNDAARCSRNRNGAHAANLGSWLLLASIGGLGDASPVNCCRKRRNFCVRKGSALVLARHGRGIIRMRRNSMRANGLLCAREQSITEAPREDNMAFLTQYKRILCNAAVSAGFALSILNSASAGIVDAPVGVIAVGGGNYYLNLTYFDGPSASHTFNSLEPTMTFTTQVTAEAARQAVIDMYLPNDLPTTTPPMAYQGFYIPYEANATNFSHVIAHDAYSDNVWDTWDVGHNPNAGRNDTIVVAIAEFDRVPLPPAIWLFGSGLVGLVSLRKKFNNK